MKIIKTMFVICLISLCPLAASAEVDNFFIKLPCRGVSTSAVKIVFVGSNPCPVTMLFREIPIRFYPWYDAEINNDPLRWWSSNPAKGMIMYEDIYEGVDIICYRGGEVLRYDIILSSWVDPATIRIRVSNNECGALKERMMAYQYIVGMRIDVPVDVCKNDDGTWSFHILRYDKSKDLLIPSAAMLEEM